MTTTEPLSGYGDGGYGDGGYGTYIAAPWALEFQTPTVKVQPASWTKDQFWRHFTIDQGVSVILYRDGTHVEGQAFDQDQFDDPTVLYYYRGGYTYFPSAPEVTALTAAGYTLSFAPAPDGYSAGVGGDTNFGDASFGDGIFS